VYTFRNLPPGFYFGSIRKNGYTTTNAKHGAWDDPDEDDYPNVFEMEAGTNLEDDTSYLFADEITVSETQVSVMVESVPCRMYQLQ